MKNTSTLILYVSKSDNNPTNIVNMYRLEVFISKKTLDSCIFVIRRNLDIKKIWSLHELGKSDVDRHFLKKTLLYFCILLLEKLSTKSGHCMGWGNATLTLNAQTY